MTDPVAKPLTVKPEPKPKKKKFSLTTKHVKRAAPFVRAGLALAGRVKKLRPYTQLLAEVVSIGADALPDKRTTLVTRLKDLRNLIKATDGAPASELREEMDEVLDEFLRYDP
jgi:hypothetical protein